MAIDNNSLCYLFDSIFQIENIAGKPVVGGHIEVFVAGTDQKYITWQNFDGTKNPFKIPLNNDGRAVVLVEPHYTYDIYIYDSFNNMICSRLNVKPAIGGDVTVYGLTEVWHDGTMSGEGTPQSPLSVVSAGKVYDGIEPIVVNNIENKISAQHIPLGVQDPLYFVEDSETACVIGFSGEIVPEGVMTESALGFENNKITGYNGSAFSAGNEYEAGSYISIDNNTISVTGLTPLPADTASTGLVAQVSADITAMIPDTSDMATQTWVNEQGFLTAHQSLEGYATENWVSSQGYLTAHQSLDGLMSADLLESSGGLITGYNGSAFAGQGGGGVTGDYELSAGSGISIVDYPLEQKTVISVTAQGGNPEVEQAVIDNSATWNTVSDKLDTTAFSDVSGTFLTAHQSLAGYATENWVTGQGYLTAETDWTNTITAASANAYNEATAAIPTGLATTGDLQTVSGEITALIPSTAGLATEDWVTGQGYITNDAITGKQDITGMTAYATVESLTAKQDAGDYLSATDSANFLLTSDSGNFYPSDNPSAFITGVDLTPYQTTADMVNYQTTAGMTAYQEAGEYYSASNPSGFLVADDITGKLDASVYAADSGNFLTAVPDTYLQNTDLSTEDGKVTAISGIPLSAGGSVPEGVMVESAVGYNAVNEISGYNGSAIAQYGAEKQWLVTDDTLLTLSNSAQFALGVNLSAVQSLMNVSPISACVTQVNITATGNAGQISTVVAKVTADIPAGWEFMTWNIFRTIGWVGSVYPNGITNSAVDLWGVYGGNHTSTATCKVECGYLIRKTI